RDVDIYKVSGLSSAKLWYARVTDFDALLRAVLDGSAPRELVEVNLSVARNLAVRLKEKFSVPGMEAYTKDSNRIA
ncbi:MAG: hypothetical protein MN733_17170, partial [Nitrososphaera sp.]|nr:hypothetical protein [Nitrososphaera sp.]